ncbi:MULTISPECIES: hypothetical protein [Sorangium]|nr:MULTISPECIES: hypothetical protein [Sorangium]
MAEIGRPRAKVRVCEKPVLGGVAEALKWERISTILDLWGGQTDLFLLIVDRDGAQNAGRRAALDSLEQRSASLPAGDRVLLGELAIEEIEVWVLAGHNLPSGWKWRDIRTDPHPKESYFASFLTEHRKLSSDAAGRAIVAEEAARSIRRVLQLCPEDLGRLAERIRARL